MARIFLPIFPRATFPTRMELEVLSCRSRFTILGCTTAGGEQTLVTVLTADLNGDGREDLVHVRTNNGGKLIFIPFLANGAGGFVPQPLYDTGVHYSGGE